MRVRIDGIIDTDMKTFKSKTKIVGDMVEDITFYAFPNEMHEVEYLQIALYFEEMVRGKYGRQSNQNYDSSGY